MRRTLALAATLFVSTSAVRADAPRPIRWEARVSPLDSSSGMLTYAVASSGMTTVPVPGTGFSCIAGPPKVVATNGVRGERTTLTCAVASGPAAMIEASCLFDGGPSLQTFVLLAPDKRGQSYVVGLACAPTPPPAPPPPKPVEKSL